MILLVAAALGGASVHIAMLWQGSPVLAIATAPLTGSVAAAFVGVALHWLRPPHWSAERAPLVSTDDMVAALSGMARRGRERPATHQPNDVRRRAG